MSSREYYWTTILDKILVLPDPDFLSRSIRMYIDEIAIQSGRRVAFGNLRGLNSQVGILPSIAALLSPPDWPIAIIYLDTEQINQFKYESFRHDPVIAHEITHLRLLIEGWYRILPNGYVDNETSSHIRIVENWLTDPVVNVSIIKRGFGLDGERDAVANEYLERLTVHRMLNQHLAIDAAIKSTDIGTKDHNTIRYEDLINSQRMGQLMLFISLSLEPGITQQKKHSLDRAFAQTFPQFYDFARNILEVITTNGYETPEKYRSTAELILKILGISTGKFRFVPHEQITPQYQQEWVTMYTRGADNWTA